MLKAHMLQKKSSIQIMNNLMKNNNLEVPIDNSHNNYSSVHIKATIDKSFLNNASGREFLLGSVAILNQDKRFNEIDVIPEHVPVYASNNSALGYIEGVRDATYDYPSSVKITGAPDGQNMHTIKYVFHLNKNENFADDLTIDSTFTSIGLNPWNTHYYGLRGTSKTNPFNSKWITSDHTYSVKITIQDHDPWEGQWPNYQPAAADANKLSTSIDGNGYMNIFGPSFSRNLNSKMPDNTYHRVFQISSLPNDDGFINKINFDNSFMTNRPEFWAVSPDGTKLAYAWVPRNNSQNLKKLADSLTPKQVYDASDKNDTGAYSVQQDGSIIFSYNYNPSTFFKFDKNAQNLLDASIENGYAYNIWAQNDKVRKQIMDQTHAQLEKSNHQAMHSRLIIEHLILQDNSKPARLVLIDLADGSSSSSTTNTQNVVFTPLGAHTQTSIYKQINVKFVDDTDSKKVLSTKPIFKGTNHTLNVTLSPENTDSTLTHIDIPSSYALSDVQPDLSKFSYDQATKTFHYGVVKDTNPDIIIHVKHKIVKGVSGDDKTLDNYPNIKKALNASIRLVVNHNYPDNGKFTDENEYPRQYVESIALKRTADVDLTTDSIVSGTVGKWTEASSNNHITFENGLLSPAPATIFISPSKGYTAYNADTSEKMPSVFTIIDSNEINDLDVLKNGGMFSKSINIVYKADQQSVKVKFVDDDDPNKAQVGDIITVNGVTDGQADFKDAIAAYKQDQAKHYELTGDTYPNALKHTFIANDSTVLTVHLKHQHAKSTVQAPATRTIIVHMPDGTTKIYVQTIGFVNNIDKDLVTNKTTNIYTIDASKSNTTINGTVDSSIHAYRKTGNNDANGTNYKFASFVLPKIPGYTAHIKPVSINSNMRLFSVSFMALPKVSSITSQKVTPKPAKPAPIETQASVETHDLNTNTLTTNDPLPDTLVFNNIESNELTWQIGNKNLNNNSINVPYYLTNTIYKVRLPRFNNYELRLVKRGTTQDSVSFMYINKQTQLNYVFNLTIQGNKYYLTVYKIDHVNRKMIPIKTYNVISYQYLLDIFDKYCK